MSLVGQLGLNRSGATRSIPLSFRHPVHVGPREHVFLHLVEQFAWSSLVRGPRRACHSPVLELAKHQLLIADEHRASGISIISRSLLTHTQLLQNIVYDNGGLREDCSGCLGCWKVGYITQSENVAELVVLECVDIHIEIPVFMRKLTTSDELRR